MPISLPPTEQELFRACTMIAIGNGARTNFWNDNGLHGRAPEDIAPDCFRLAWRKNHSVTAASGTHQQIISIHPMKFTWQDTLHLQKFS
jgi:hypothetical protein